MWRKEVTSKINNLHWRIVKKKNRREIIRDYQRDFQQSGSFSPYYFQDINTDYYPTEFGSVPIIEINDYYSLAMLIGELKSHFSGQNIRILLRGQRNNNAFTQIPSIFRHSELLQEMEDNIGNRHQSNFWIKVFQGNLSSQKKAQFITWNSKVRKPLGEEFELNFVSKLFTDLFITPHMLAAEPILQHYNFKTKWLDLVDSIPIALWFASQDLKSIPESNLLLEDRENQNQYHYLFLYGIQTNKYIEPGIWESDSLRLVNLVETIGSVALRPHMQFAYSVLDKGLDNLLMRTGADDNALKKLCNCDYAKFLFCIIKLKRKNILNWLFTPIKSTNGSITYSIPKILQYKTLFPPPIKDNFFQSIYNYLLDSKEKNKEILDFNQSIYTEEELGLLQFCRK